jgi:hypothetical protein
MDVPHTRGQLVSTCNTAVFAVTSSVVHDKRHAQLRAYRERVCLADRGIALTERGVTIASAHFIVASAHVIGGADASATRPRRAGLRTRNRGGSAHDRHRDE